ncbi:hypothetical protein JHW43_006202 [Diplocarpon mali]|nr:hypothetical protein JHW43_006202 [Diplocarpon mali]
MEGAQGNGQRREISWVADFRTLSLLKLTAKLGIASLRRSRDAASASDACGRSVSRAEVNLTSRDPKLLDHAISIGPNAAAPKQTTVRIGSVAGLTDPGQDTSGNMEIFASVTAPPVLKEADMQYEKG